MRKSLVALFALLTLIFTSCTSAPVRTVPAGTAGVEWKISQNTDGGTLYKLSLADGVVCSVVYPTGSNVKVEPGSVILGASSSFAKDPIFVQAILIGPHDGMLRASTKAFRLEYAARAGTTLIGARLKPVKADEGNNVFGHKCVDAAQRLPLPVRQAIHGLFEISTK